MHRTRCELALRLCPVAIAPAVITTGSVPCCDTREARQDVPKRKGVVVVTTGPDRDVRSFMVHLQAAGINHVTEVRRLSDAGSSRSCTSDRRLHQFIEEVVNGPMCPDADFDYRCIDMLDGIRDDDAQLQRVTLPDVELLAAVPRASEDLIAMTDNIACALRLPLIANDSTTSQCRIDKYAMQEALHRHGVAGVRQVLVKTYDEAKQAMAESQLDFPVVVKPLNSGASDGVRLCHSDQDIKAAIDENIGELGVYRQVKNHVVIQEYLQGDEFVVNTVSLKGQHRVLDMWHAIKHADGTQIFYGHQLLVEDSKVHADIVNFSLQVLDAVGLSGGPGHLEVVRTRAGVRLIEINPRSHGHSPRASRQVGEDQLSTLASAIARPDEFLLQAQRSPHYKVKGNPPELVMVVFLRADKDSEVHRDDLLQIVGLSTFWRFDRIGVPMFADSLKEANADSFWVCAQTQGLFTVPLTVLLRGPEHKLKADLASIREMEGSMYRPFGTHDPAGYMGPLEGANAANWHADALARANVPKVGHRLEVLPGKSFQLTDGSHAQVDYYKESDTGTVSKWSKDRILITWDRTGLTTSIGKLTWAAHFNLVEEGPEVPEVGSRLQVLPGKQFQCDGSDGPTDIYGPGDFGTVTGWTEDRLLVTWDRTGLACSLVQRSWAEKFKLISVPVPQEGSASSTGGAS